MSAAQIIYEDTERKVTLDYLMRTLEACLPYKASLTEWRGFGAVIPQVKIETDPPFAIQIADNPEYVPEEIQEYADTADEEKTLPPESVTALRRCRSRLEIVTCRPTSIVQGGAGGILTWQPTDVDPSIPEVRAIILFLANLLGGFAHDDLNAGWILPDIVSPTES